MLGRIFMSTSLNIFRKDFHAVVVIDRKEFVVILLADLVADDLPVDDGRHLVLALYGDGCSYLADLDLPAVPFFSVPALALVKDGNIPSIDGSSRTIRHLLPELVFPVGEDFLLLLLTLRQFLLYFGVQTRIRCLLSRSAIVTLSANPPDNPFRTSSRFSTGCSSMELEVRTAVFFFRQVIDQIGGHLDCTVSVRASLSTIRPWEARHSCHFSLEK